jgi:HK97 gp10 family phage protein
MVRIEGFKPEQFNHAEVEKIALARLVDAADVVAQAARRLCPVGKSHPKYQTGAYAGQDWTAREAGQLRDSIRVVLKKAEGGAALSRPLNVRVYVGNKRAFYARMVEYGTSKMRARPFMRPALAAAANTVKSILGVK